MQTQPPAKAETRGRRAWLPVLLWSFLILGLGGDDASKHTTSRFIGPLLRWLFPEALQETLDLIHFALRKSAHLVEYGVLALLVRHALAASGSRSSRASGPRTRCAPAARGGSSPPRPALGALLTVLVIAALDEGRQAFSATRSGSAGDVALDLLGGVLALALAIAYTRVMNDRRRLPRGA